MENSSASNKQERPFSADDIEVLTGIQAIRRRPKMYVGSTDLFGLMHYLAESIKIMLVRQAREIELTIANEEFRLASDATFNFKSEDLLPSLFEQIYAPGNGTIPALLNALSDGLKIATTSALKTETICYRKGERISRDFQTGEAGESGTTLVFKPDGSLFSVTRIPRGMIVSYLRRMSYLHPGVRFSFKDDQSSHLFYSANGLLDLFEAMAAPYPLFHQPVHLKAEVEELSLELVFAYQQGKDNRLISFMNGLPALEGGTHEEGLREAFPAINSALGLPADFPYGWLAVASLQYAEVCWDGEQRQKVSFHPDMKEQLRAGVIREAEQWAGRNPEIVAEMQSIPT